MKLLVGLLTLVLALAISGVAAYFSIVGLAALFAGAVGPVIVMGSVLEAGKLMSAGWLHANWKNPSVSRLHKAYLTCAVIVLMGITSLGIYGFLARGHLEQEAPLASVELQIGQIEQRIAHAKDERARLEERQRQLDQSVNVLLGTSKSAKEAQAANKARQAQAREREQLRKDMAAKDKEIVALSESLLPLKSKINDVAAKLGPIKYVADGLHWKDPNTAVQFVILMIMVVFDPLAVVLLLSATITFGEIPRRDRKAPPERTDGKPETTTESVNRPVNISDSESFSEKFRSHITSDWTTNISDFKRDVLPEPIVNESTVKTFGEAYATEMEHLGIRPAGASAADRKPLSYSFDLRAHTAPAIKVTFSAPTLSVSPAPTPAEDGWLSGPSFRKHTSNP